MATKKNVQEAKEVNQSREMMGDTSYNRLNKQWPWIKKYKGPAAK
jgi:hypothetical protein